MTPRFGSVVEAGDPGEAPDPRMPVDRPVELEAGACCSHASQGSGPWVILPLILGLLAQGRLLFRDPVWDDRLYLDEIRLRGLWSPFSPDLFGLVRPGKWAMFALSDGLFGDWMIGWQAICFLLLLLTIVLMWQLSRTLLSVPGATVSTCLLAVHPLHTEATGWFSAANTTAMTCLSLGYLMVLFHSMRSNRPGLFGLLGGLLLILAVLTKEEAVALPVCAALLILWHVGRCGVWLAGAGAHGVVAVLLLAGLRSRQFSGGGGDSIPDLPGWVLSVGSPGTTLLHLGWFAFPFRWAYYTNPVSGPGMLLALAMLALVLLVILAVLYRRSEGQGRRPIRFLLLACICLAPLMNVVPMGNPLFGVRYLGLAGVWLALLLGCLGELAWRRRGLVRLLVMVLGGIWLVCCGLVSVRDHGLWGSNLSLFSAIAEADPSGENLRRLAEARLAAGDLAGAAETASRAVELNPGDAGARLLLALSLVRGGRAAEGLEEMQRAHGLRPDDPEIALHLAGLYEEIPDAHGDASSFSKADSLYAIAARARTANGEIAHLNWGVMHALRGDPGRALAIWRQGLEMFPGSADLKANIAIAERELAAGKVSSPD